MNLPAVRSQRDLAIILSKDIPKYLSPDEVRAVLWEVRDKPKNHLLISMLWQTGARISEALGIRVADIDFYTKTIQIATLKRKRGAIMRALPLKDGLKGDIGAFVASSGLKKEDHLFSFSRQRAHKIVREACRAAGIDEERAHPHVFRHSFAVFAIMNGVPVLVLQKWLGHANIQNTLIYTQILSQDTRHFFEGMDF